MTKSQKSRSLTIRKSKEDRRADKISVLSVVARLVFHCWDVGARRGAAAADDRLPWFGGATGWFLRADWPSSAELYRYVLALLIALAMGAAAGVGPCSEQ